MHELAEGELEARLTQGIWVHTRCMRTSESAAKQKANQPQGSISRHGECKQGQTSDSSRRLGLSMHSSVVISVPSPST